ncbi:MAG: ATP-binding protein [Calditrichaeota bacterium]|nr:ATP-binding protein [Calditrichota bacterium]
MESKKKTGSRIESISIRNFKAIDSLEVKFPLPLLPSDLDVTVLGSKNGLGKTSLLESCALPFVIGLSREPALFLERFTDSDISIDFSKLFIRGQSKSSSIELLVKNNGSTYRINTEIKRKDKIRINGDKDEFSKLLFRESEHIAIRKMETPDEIERMLLSFSSISSEPLIIPPLLYFHSYRKVREGNPELGAMLESPRFARRYHRYSPVGMFKIEILKLLMSQAEIFEIDSSKGKSEIEEHIRTLKELVYKYAGGDIAKLVPLPNNTLEFWISKKDDSFPFDGLSSGQKEIISLLFLIQYYTKDSPGIVLIDEPELHLNAEWQIEFCKQLKDLAPRNQYILATHSIHIFKSVLPEQRIMLEEEN